MNSYAPADIRNFAIVGHASSGKTMLAEAMLMCGGVINRMGRIADGTTGGIQGRHRRQDQGDSGQRRAAAPTAAREAGQGPGHRRA